jgi:hypothetical protein
MMRPVLSHIYNCRKGVRWQWPQLVHLSRPRPLSESESRPQVTHNPEPGPLSTLFRVDVVYGSRPLSESRLVKHCRACRSRCRARPTVTVPSRLNLNHVHLRVTPSHSQPQGPAFGASKSALPGRECRRHGCERMAAFRDNHRHDARSRPTALTHSRLTTLVACYRTRSDHHSLPSSLPLSLSLSPSPSPSLPLPLSLSL